MGASRNERAGGGPESPAPRVERGEIRYIEIPYSTGHEIRKSRPGIIVSCDPMNRTSPCVEVVYCSPSDKRDMPGHITVRSTPVPSTALCEHIYTVDRSRVGRLMGRCTKNEMDAIDIGLVSGLGIGVFDLARPDRALPEEEPAPVPDAPAEASAELIRAQAERDAYKSLYEALLDRMSMERRTGA